jgi:MoaA/NifB/PqqE/SkfB family radical SAM enzyme
MRCRAGSYFLIDRAGGRAGLFHALFKKMAWAVDAIQVNGSILASLSGVRAHQRSSLALRYWGWRKLFNLVMVELQLRFGRTRVRGYPFEWEVDTTNVCQLKCPLCHTGLGTVHRDKGVMHFDTFTSTVDQMKDYCIWLSLYSWGEPFLNKDIDRFIAYAHEKRIATIVSSNLNKPLTPEMAERLIKSGLDVLIISLDGTTQDVYEVYRVTGHLDRVLENLRLIVETRKRLGSKTPFLEWQYIVMRQNEHQVENARRMAQEMGVDTITFKPVDFPHGSEDIELARQWLPRADLAARLANPFRKPYSEDGARCWRLWRSAVVNWDGGYAPCCYLTDASDDFGNVRTHSIKEIWNNGLYRTARGLFQKSGTPKEYVGCIDCSVYTASKAAKSRDSASMPRRNGHAPLAWAPLAMTANSKPARPNEASEGVEQEVPVGSSGDG